MSPSDITFSINEYSRDGDCIDRGVFLHFGGTRVKVADTTDEFTDIVRCINDIYCEITGDTLPTKNSG